MIIREGGGLLERVRLVERGLIKEGIIRERALIREGGLIIEVTFSREGAH